ncbi:iron chelate uptake ABC transporter family permease subunit [Streptomyces globisporus]|uniref:Iron chelate uptake ABC transporter family permease subunit n=1 Tax=Streptomyces globisporus TaxID=1908 RepID=A0A927BNQ2_STRGL|nr:iron chelate uptake ABC transporter family permease subunit [Streptomyces globisporus]
MRGGADGRGRLGGGRARLRGTARAHLALAVFGADLRVTLPGAALLGAVVVAGADAAAQLLSRLLSSALDADRLTLPVGALTTCVGAGLLLAVARRRADER